MICWELFSHIIFFADKYLTLAPFLVCRWFAGLHFTATVTTEALYPFQSERNKATSSDSALPPLPEICQTQYCRL